MTRTTVAATGLLLAAAIVGCGVLAAAWPTDRGPEAAALIVGDTTLTIGQVDPVLDRVLTTRSLLVAEWPREEARAELHHAVHQVWDALIDEQLVIAEARRRGLTVPQEEIEARVHGLEQGLPNLYRIVVAKEGLAAYKAKLRMQLLHRAATEQVAAEEARRYEEGGSPPDDILLACWLARARSGLRLRVLYRPDISPYLPGGVKSGP